MTDTAAQPKAVTETNASVAPKRPRRRHLLVRIVVYPLALYITYCGALYFMQDRMMFPGEVAPPPLKFPPIKETITWERSRVDGTRGVAWLIPAPGASAQNPRPVVIYFHGNAEIIDHQVDRVEGFRRMGCSVLLPEYPGYGRSQGVPGQVSIMNDADYFYSRLLKTPEIDASRIYIYGRSIGGGPAAQLAALHEPAALILESTFTSMASFADGYFAPRFLVRHPFHTDDVVASLHAPLLIMHGTRDTIVPFYHAARLRNLATQSTHVGYVVYDCGHIEFPGRNNEEDCWRRIETFLSEHAGLDPNPAKARKEFGSPS